MELLEKPCSRVYKFRPHKVQKVGPAGMPIPLPRSGHRSVVDDSNLYHFGGYNPHLILHDGEMEEDDSTPLFRELWKFNFATKCWTKIKTSGFMPKEVASHAALLYGHFLLIYGGTGVPFGFSSSNTLHVCDLRTCTWRKIETTGEPPEKQYGQAMVLIDSNLYVCGGTTGYEYTSAIHRLDLKTSHWEELKTKSYPTQRYRHEIATDRNCIYVFGGGTAIESYRLDEIPVFDIQLNQWRTLKTHPDPEADKIPRIGTVSPGYPSPRRCHSLVQLRNNVYICGGYNGKKIFPDIWQFNLETCQWWRLHCKLTRPVYFHSAAVTKSGCMYIFGGVTKIHKNTRTSYVYSVWLEIPPLREICWAALAYFVPNMKNVNKEKLLEIGIPADLLDRIE